MHSNFVAAACGAALSLSISVISTAAQAVGPFDQLNGNWRGSGTLLSSDGKSESIRCRASYSVSEAGSRAQLLLRCAGASDGFFLSALVKSSGGTIQGTWSEQKRNSSGTVSGTGDARSINANVKGSNFSASLAMQTNGNRQLVTIRAPGRWFSEVRVSLSRR